MPGGYAISLLKKTPAVIHLSEATKEVPKRLQHPKQHDWYAHPNHPVALALLEELGEPLLSSTDFAN
jgi:tRNA A37 threonylcarbamoyladenosine synthetase subunit TsaC/SUA5/YrdC